MATRDEVLRDLISRVDILEGRVRDLEKQDDWTGEFQPVPDQAPMHPDPRRVMGTGPLPQSGEPDADIDANDPAVLAAKKRLAEDDGRPPEAPLETEVMAVPTPDGNLQIEIPKASVRQLERRKLFIDAGGLTNFVGLPQEVVEEAYLKGGPLWLHAYDRDYVMSLPGEARAAMAQDVYETSPVAAGELARDILKNDDDETLSAWAMTQAEQVFNG